MAAAAASNSVNELREFLRAASSRVLTDQKRLEDLAKAKTKNILSYCVLEGRSDLLFAFLSFGGLDINELDESDKTPLFHATEKCDYPSFLFLLQAKADPTITGMKNSRNLTPLHLAVERKMNYFIYTLCWFTKTTTYSANLLDAETGFLINNTALQKTITNKNLMAAHMLCAAGADVNKEALQYAVHSKKKDFIQLLISYGADPALKNKRGKSALDYADAEILPLLTVATPAIVPSTSSPVNVAATPLKYIFSQRSVTCGPDSIFTILFNADPFGPDFQEAALSGTVFPTKPSNTAMVERLAKEKEINEEAESTGYYGINKLLFKGTRKAALKPISFFDDTLFHAFKRYRAMKGLEAAAMGNRVRRPSLNAGEGIEILKCITGRPDSGTYFSEAVEAIDTILIKNSYGILKADYHLKQASYTLSEKDPVIPSFDKVCTILLGFHPSDATKSGHYVCVLKMDDEWYYGDNEVGYLHKFEDPTFMPTFYKGLGSKCTFQNNALLILPTTLSTGSPDFKSFLFHSEGVYPPNPKALSAEYLFGGIMYPLINFNIIYQEPVVAAVTAAKERRGKRKTRRASHWRRQSRRQQRT
jgi:hypothetical protein